MRGARETATLHRRAVVAALLAGRPEGLVAVSSLGNPTWDLAAAGDDPRNFHFIGAMGQAAPFALGLAIAQPGRRVLLLAGDGETLMGLGALATIASQALANLAVVVLDNESYVETGSQPTATAGSTDLEAVARGCGIATTRKVTREAELGELRELVLGAPGPVFALVKIVPEALPLVFPHSFDGATAINRFRGALVRDD